MPHVLIVGAGPGIAAATARRFGRDGYDVGLVARREDPLAELGEQLRGEGVTARWAPADAGDAAALTAAVERLIEEIGPVDVVLYNVSIGREVAAAELTPEQLTADLAAGAVACRRRCAPCCPACARAAAARCWSPVEGPPTARS
jgi:short-subunit dehydrogenase